MKKILIPLLTLLSLNSFAQNTKVVVKGGGGPGVASYGKNATLDSTILTLTNGTRYAAKDNDAGGFTTNIFNDTTIIICSNGTNLCDTAFVTNVGNLQTVTILNNSTLEVCGNTGCDTLMIPSAIIFSGWGLTGNAGTDTSVNFIGTTDSKGFTIKTNNRKRAYFDTLGRVTFPALTAGSTAGEGLFMADTSGAKLAAFQALNSGGSHAYFGVNKYFNGITWQDMGQGIVGSAFKMINDQFQFYQFGTGASITATPLQVVSNGNVGIGNHAVADPASPLDIRASVARLIRFGYPFDVQYTYTIGRNLSTGAMDIAGDAANPQTAFAFVDGPAIIGAAAGTNPVASARLEVVSTTQGFLPPRMTATQASAISSPAEGLMVYVTNTNGTFTAKGWWGYNGAAWEKLNN